jgi:hypothetical protein
LFLDGNEVVIVVDGGLAVGFGTSAVLVVTNKVLENLLDFPNTFVVDVLFAKPKLNNVVYHRVVNPTESSALPH